MVMCQIALFLTVFKLKSTLESIDSFFLKVTSKDANYEIFHILFFQFCVLY